jgi:hypothetical protein
MYIQESLNILLVFLQTFLRVLDTFDVVLQTLNQVDQPINLLGQVLHFGPKFLKGSGKVVFDGVDVFRLVLYGGIEALSKRHRNGVLTELVMGLVMRGVCTYNR